MLDQQAKDNYVKMAKNTMAKFIKKIRIEWEHPPTRDEALDMWERALQEMDFTTPIKQPVGAPKGNKNAAKAEIISVMIANTNPSTAERKTK